MERLIIEAGRAERHDYFLAWRDILVRCKQTVIGVACSLLRPLLAATLFLGICSFGRAETNFAGVIQPMSPLPDDRPARCALAVLSCFR